MLDWLRPISRQRFCKKLKVAIAFHQCIHVLCWFSSPNPNWFFYTQVTGKLKNGNKVYLRTQHVFKKFLEDLWICFQCCQKVFTEFRAKSSKISEILASFYPNFGLFRALFSQNFIIFAPASQFYCIFM